MQRNHYSFRTYSTRVLIDSVHTPPLSMILVYHQCYMLWYKLNFTLFWPFSSFMISVCWWAASHTEPLTMVYCQSVLLEITPCRSPSDPVCRYLHRSLLHTIFLLNELIFLICFRLLIQSFEWIRSQCLEPIKASNIVKIPLSCLIEPNCNCSGTNKLFNIIPAPALFSSLFHSYHEITTAGENPFKWLSV